METRTLKHTDLTASRACFGTMTFGSQADEAASIRMIDRCFDAGVNFFDTANAYNKGLSETIVGKALKGRRDKIILASKVRGKMGEAPDQAGLSKRAMLRAIDESLKRLQTDYLDVYYLHQPDYAVPIEESLEAMEQLVREGKVRYPASSNYSGWQVCRMLWLAEKNSYKPAWITQPMYNLVAARHRTGILADAVPSGHWPSAGVGGQRRSVNLSASGVLRVVPKRRCRRSPTAGRLKRPVTEALGKYLDKHPGILHPALKKGLDGIYGYACDEGTLGCKSHRAA